MWTFIKIKQTDKSPTILTVVTPGTAGGGGYVELSTDNFVFGWLKMGRLVTQWVYRKIYSAHSQEKQILQLKKKQYSTYSAYS